MRTLPNDVARCRGQNCNLRDVCLRHLNHVHETTNSSVVYGRFDELPGECSYIIQVEPDRQEK